MPTRRPNVPRASTGGAKAAGTKTGVDPAHGTDAEILRPKFGNARSGGAATPTTASSPAAATGSSKAPKGTSSSGSPAKSGSPGQAAAKSGRSGSSVVDGALRTAAREAASRAGNVRDSAARALGRNRGAADDENGPVPAKAFSGRMLALAVVLISITILLAPTVRVYLQQRADIATLQEDIKSKQQEQQDLKNQVSRWSDPAYVRQQARDRINMVMPGETGYWVFGGDTPPATPETKGTAVNPSNLPWVDALWQSIERSAKE